MGDLVAAAIAAARDNVYLATALGLVVGWIVLATAYVAWYLAPLAVPAVDWIRRRLEPAVERRARRRHGVEVGGPVRGVCGRCRSVYRLGLGACDTCGAAADEATPIPEM